MSIISYMSNFTFTKLCMQGFFVVTNFNPTFPFCKLLMAPGGAKMNYYEFKVSV